MTRNTFGDTALESKDDSDLHTEKKNLDSLDLEKDPLLSTKKNYEDHKAKLEEIVRCIKLKEHKAKFKDTNHETFELPKIRRDCSENWKNKENIPTTFHLRKSTDKIKPFDLEKALKDVSDRYNTKSQKIKETKTDTMSNRILLKKCGIEIPRNICHQFRQNVCDELLSKVNDKTNWKIKDVKENQRHQTIDVSLTDHDYLGMLMRSNVFSIPSISRFNNTSYTQYYNGWNTFNKRDIYVPNQFRFRCDELSRWSNASIVEKRIFKEWQNKYNEMMQNKTKV